MQWKKKKESNKWIQFIITASFVKKEMEVGIMTATTQMSEQKDMVVVKS